MELYFDIMFQLLKWSGIFIWRLCVWGFAWLVVATLVLAALWPIYSMLNRFTRPYWNFEKCVSHVSIVLALVLFPMVFLETDYVVCKLQARANNQVCQQ